MIVFGHFLVVLVVGDCFSCWIVSGGAIVVVCGGGGCWWLKI